MCVRSLRFWIISRQTHNVHIPYVILFVYLLSSAWMFSSRILMVLRVLVICASMRFCLRSISPTCSFVRRYFCFSSFNSRRSFASFCSNCWISSSSCAFSWLVSWSLPLIPASFCSQSSRLRRVFSKSVFAACANSSSCTTCNQARSLLNRFVSFYLNKNQQQENRTVNCCYQS